MKRNLINKALRMGSLLNIAIHCLLILSCSKRNLVYFSDMPEPSVYNTPINNYVPPKIQPNDLISIAVSTLNRESNVLFNSVLLPTEGGVSANVVGEQVNTGYLVDMAGFINFPVIGKISVGGLTREKAQEKITNLLSEHVKDPIVNVRYVNFKVTVIGEVLRPSTFTVPTERITILEALGLAGDMTGYGKRENVLIIREKDGVRNATKVNMNSKDLLTSPYYYLQQNDVVYVEPDNKVKRAATDPGNRFIGMVTALITTTAFVLISIYQN